MGRVVRLTYSEICQGALIGGLRHASSCAKNSNPAHGFDSTKHSALGVHCEGACGEIAFSKWRNLYWPATVDNFKEADIGKNIQVRTRSSHNYDLIVRDDDKDSHIFILVTGFCPDYQIQGWIYGHEGKKEKFKKAYGNRNPAYFVPQDELRPLNG